MALLETMGENIRAAIQLLGVRASFTIPLIQTGVATLVAGTVTVSSVTLTSSSRIFVTLKIANTPTLTVQYIALGSGRNTGAGTFVIQANVAAGTINVADISTLDWLIIG